MSTQILNTPSYPASLSVRYRQLDFLRGLMLIVMTVDHLDSVLKPVTYQTFGFVSAAEGFVFLSGLVGGIVFTRRVDKYGLVTTKKNMLSRAWQIHQYQIVLLIFTIVLLLNIDSFRAFWYSRLHLLTDAPWLGLALGSTLLYQPVLLDILPIYSIFLLAAPFVLTQILNGRALWVVFISVGLWALGTKGIRGAITGLFFEEYTFELSNFNIFSWQLLFFGGMVLGYLQYHQKISFLLEKRSIFIISMIICAVLFVVRHTGFDPEFVNIHRLTNKINLGPLRLLNFMALSLVIGYLFNKFSRLGKFTPIELLGRHSLQVYSFHVILIIIALPVLHNLESFSFWDGISQWKFALLLLFNLLCALALAIPAHIHTFAKK